MGLPQVIALLPTYLLALVRIGGVVMFAPIIGTSLVPRRVKVIVALALTLGLLPAIPLVHALPKSGGLLILAIASELVFGMAIGLAANLAFMAAQWAGELIGQQMGFTLSGLLDPEAGAQDSLFSDFYLMLAIVVFLLVEGHLALIQGLAASFQTLPLMSAQINHHLLDVLVGLLQAATVLALELAAPLIVTMLLVDIVLGLMTRIVPQMGVMAMALSIRSAIGLIVILAIAALTAGMLGSTMMSWMKMIGTLWTHGAAG